MIARPVHRPTPIAFDGPKAKPGASQPRAISWAAASGPAPHEPPAMQPRPFVATRLSPVKPPLTPAPLAPDNPTASELSARYVGQGALSVRSSVTGRHYRFQGHGDSQKVDKHDLMLLKRIADLVIR
jgi:hypothetical protein